MATKDTIIPFFIRDYYILLFLEDFGYMGRSEAQHKLNFKGSDLRRLYRCKGVQYEIHKFNG